LVVQYQTDRDGFPSQIVIENEKWIHQSQPEIKLWSMEWQSHDFAMQEKVYNSSLNGESDSNCLLGHERGDFGRQQWILRHASLPCKDFRGAWSKIDQSRKCKMSFSCMIVQNCTPICEQQKPSQNCTGLCCPILYMTHIWPHQTSICLAQ
jgi:hypothetical protein